MFYVRTFIALDFDDDLKKVLSNIQNKIKINSFKGSWVNNENFHLTLKFLGEIDEKQGEIIGNILKSISEKNFAISLRLDELGYFNKRKDQYGVIWVGIKGEIDKLNKIYDIIEEDMEPLGFKKEKRPFRPHITLGRRIILDRNMDQEQFLKDIKIDYKFLLDKLVLMRSEKIMGKREYISIKSYKLIDDHR